MLGEMCTLFSLDLDSFFLNQLFRKNISVILSVSNNLDPDQVRLSQTVCKGYQYSLLSREKVKKVQH